MLSDKRAKELLQQIIAWACEHDAQLVKDMCNATDMTYDEACSLEVDDYTSGYDPAGDAMVEWNYTNEVVDAAFYNGDIDNDKYEQLQKRISDIHHGKSSETYEDILKEVPEMS